MRLFPVLVAVVATVALAAAPRAQELDCDVVLNTTSLSGNEFQFLQDELGNGIRRYLNDRAWTEDLFENREQIDCGFQITVLSSQGLSTFQAELVVRASRPIYGTSQRTQTLLIPDRSWTFTYNRGQSLIYDPNSYDDLTSVIDFYVMLILGYDYDSFSELGGTPFFEQARETAELGRSRASTQWTSDIGTERSRYTLITELLDPAFAPLRRATFAYHFKVLDHFVLNPEQAWADAMATFEALNELYREFNRRRYVTDVFFASKYEEIAELMVDAPQRSEAYALLSEMDAAHVGTYDVLVSGR